MREILISGYYGFNNSGDDALLQSIIDNLKTEHKDYKIVVLSKNPEQTKKTYNVGAISRINPFSVIWHMIKAKLLISGGGTLIQDATSTKSLIYYLAIISIAKLFGVKVMLYANGIGPVIQPKNKKRTKKVLNKADYITLRDEKSKKVLSELEVIKPEVEVTADPVFLIESADKTVGEKILEKYGIPKDKKIIGISVREWKKADLAFCDKMSSAVSEICNKLDLYPVFLPLQPKDNGICEKISQKCGVKNTVIKEHLEVSDMLSVISNFYMTIGMRLHMLIYAASCAVPVVGISYDPKISGFMEYAKQDKYVSAESLDEEKLVLDIISINENYEKIKAELLEVSKLMKERAKHNCDIVSELL